MNRRQGVAIADLRQLWRDACSAAIAALMDSGARKATIFVTPNLTVKATRTVYRAFYKKPSFSKRRTEINLTIGQPNYEEREFIRKCKRAGEPFPVRKPLLKALPSTKSASGRMQHA